MPAPQLTFLIVRVSRVVLSTQNGLSSLLSTELAVLALPGGDIRDAKFVDERELIVLWHERGQWYETL